MEPKQVLDVWQVVLNVASLIGSLATIILGIIAIWLSLYFYRRSNEVFAVLTGILSRVEASSKTTEVTSTEVTRRLVDGVIGSLQKKQVDEVEQPTLLRLSEKLEQALKDSPNATKQAAIKEVREEIERLFSVLKAQAAPKAIDYDWGPLIRRIHELEGKNKFLSVKWLNQTHFAADPAMREALQVAIQDGIVELYQLENPKNPAFPTTACKLAKKHPLVEKVLVGD